ncbi:cytidine deaminase [Chloropicon primus]|uniref:Cytidine deaminase n=2 Tax=Chloropicon primus TaxID=1764295 RepID=A0A5B8MQV7_9CHLO|nr:cytidine deaminase [Chloropicon primus]UPR02153.1 cytidine deaminase [Chloropicon primus]|eukprot:QDZ22929.1 cytidine deaminase [Chloropicon primus]
MTPTTEFSDGEEGFMRLALAEATKAFGEGEIPVGCVLVRGGEVVGRGGNKTNESRNGSRHCEMEAIDEVLGKFEAGSLEVGSDCAMSKFWSEVDLYVTCEPCIMCAGAISLMGIKNVYYGCSNDKFGGCGSVHPVSDQGCGTCGGGEERFGAENVRSFRCRKGLFAEEAIAMLQDFYLRGNARAPKPHRKVLWMDRREQQQEH